MLEYTPYDNDYYRIDLPFEDGCIPPSIPSDQEYLPFGIPPLELNDIYAPIEQDDEQKRQQYVAAQLLMEKESENSSSEYYYDSSFDDESCWYLVYKVKKDPEEVKRSQLEAHKVWIEMQERGLFSSYGINHLRLDNFETIL